jgi:phosphoglycolate phosphatase
MCKLILFDIDGTLLWTDGAGRAAIRRALLDEMGMTGPIDDVRLDGKTDPQIVRELMLAAGHPDAESESHIRAVCARYVSFLGAELEQARARIRVYPGVVDLLEHLTARGDALLGLLTGNLEVGAVLKLRAAGIGPELFHVGAYGSDAADRPQLPAIAAERAARLMGRRPQGDDIVILGDTPADMTCGQAIGARAIGVATGAYSVGELTEAGAFKAFDDFSDLEAVAAAIHQ